MQIKSTNHIQKILVVLSIIIVTIVGIISNNNVIAYSSHNLKEADFIKTELYMTHTTYYVCINKGCDYKTSKTEDCEFDNFKKFDEEKHIAQCKECLDEYELPHIDENNDGKCDDCKAIVNGGKHICLQHSEEKIEVFDNVYHDYYAICTLCENPVPDWQKREAHNFGEFKSKASKGHSATCKICGYELILEHEGATHENEGKCTVKGCGYQYEIHRKSTTLTGDYTNITETTHTPIYKCTQEGCTETYAGNATSHKYQNGICECGQEKIEEEKENDKEEIQEEVVEEIEVKSEKYELKETQISKVQPKTTVREFKTNIETNGRYINIYNKYNQLVSDSSKIGTGMKIEIKNSEKTKTFTIIIDGDVNGDGESDFKDIVKINQARLNKTNLEKIYELAADITGDGKVDFKDLVKINKNRLNKQ